MSHTMRTCTYCNRKVEWLYTKFDDDRIPFDANPVDLDELPDDETGWIPGRWNVTTTTGRPCVRVVMAPLRHYGQRKQNTVEKVLTVHRCVRYLAAVRAGHAAQLPAAAR